MERTKNNTVEEPTPVVEQPKPAPKPRWKKLGGGSMHLSNPPRIIKPGEIFRAYANEIPLQFRDVVQPIDAVVEGPPATTDKTSPLPPLPKVVNPVYSMQPRGKSKLLYDIVDANGKRVNEAPMAKAAAEQMIMDLAR